MIFEKESGRESRREGKGEEPEPLKSGIRRNNNMVKREEGPQVDALARSGEEGRGKLRKAAGRSKHPVIRR